MNTSPDPGIEMLGTLRRIEDHIRQTPPPGTPEPRADIDPEDADAAGIVLLHLPEAPRSERRLTPRIEAALGRDPEVTCRLCYQPRPRTRADAGNTYDPRTCQHRAEPWHRRDRLTPPA